jgi:peptidoglycan/xylan/chitin deacetylase (PgdA/CDA1 family)
MMSGEQVRALAAMGMDVGAHTATHPILTEIDLPAARREILEGKARLESLTGRPVRVFAYPNGEPGRDYASEHVHLVEELGFQGAVTTGRGVGSHGSDMFQLPRFTPWHWRPVRAALQLTKNLASRPHVVPISQESGPARLRSNALGAAPASRR